MSEVRPLAFASGVWAVARRELLSLFVTPLAYVVGTLFLLDQGWNFSLLLRVLNDPLAAPGPVMQFYFGGSFFIFWLPVLFICTALSMGSIAEERARGTLESLLTSPLGAAEVVLGKYLGALTFYVCLWLPTAAFYVLLVGAGADPDPGPILSGYLGVLLCGSSFLALGILASAVVRTQLAAAIVTFVLGSVVLLAGLLVDQVESTWIRTALEQTSLLGMMQELAQGIVDSRFIVLHAVVTAVAIVLAVLAIDPRRDAENRVQALLVVLCGGYLAALGARHAERADWTGGQVYSLGDRAREVLAQIEVPVEVRVVMPQTLGAGQPNPVAQELREVLRRMEAVGTRLEVQHLDPDRRRAEAQQWIAQWGLGGRQLADGVVLIRAGQGPEVRRAHLLPADLVTLETGADVQATGPRVKAFRGEEALLGAFIAVARPTRPVVCHSAGHGEPDWDNFEPFGGYAHLDTLLRDANMETRVADLDSPEGLGPCDLLVVAGPQGKLPPVHVEAVRAYLDGGGRLLVLAGAVLLRGEETMVPHGLEPLLAERGIRYGDRITLDPNRMPGSSALVAFTVSDGWRDHPAVRSLAGRGVSFVFARELQVEGDAATLVTTSDQGWSDGDLRALVDGRTSSLGEGDQAGPIPLAAAAEQGGSRVVVVASDQFALNANLRPDVAYDHGRDFVINLVGWLTERGELMGIAAREREHVKLVLRPAQLDRMVLVCLLGLPGVWIVLGLLVLGGRRR